MLQTTKYFKQFNAGLSALFMMNFMFYINGTRTICVHQQNETNFKPDSIQINSAIPWLHSSIMMQESFIIIFIFLLIIFFNGK